MNKPKTPINTEKMDKDGKKMKEKGFSYYLQVNQKRTKW